MNYWHDYYLKTPIDKTPWTGVNQIFFDNIWSKFNLSNVGNLLDIGCGRGDKSIYFAQKGLNVWGFDIAESAINEAKKAAETLENPPHFFVADAASFKNVGEIDGIKFDIVLDLLVTQFLNKPQKQDFINNLKENLISQKTYYILTTFIKDNEDDPMEGYEEWVKKNAQSPKDIEEVYLRHFTLVEKFEKPGPKGKVGTFILLAK